MVEPLTDGLQVHAALAARLVEGDELGQLPVVGGQLQHLFSQMSWRVSRVDSTWLSSDTSQGWKRVSEGLTENLPSLSQKMWPG